MGGTFYYNGPLTENAVKLPTPHDDGPRILVVGDSWAQYILWAQHSEQDKEKGNPFANALHRKGYKSGYVTGNEKDHKTAVGSTYAQYWARAKTGVSMPKDKDNVSLETITNALNHYKNINIVHLSLGGNDIFARMDTFLKEYKSILETLKQRQGDFDYNKEHLKACQESFNKFSSNNKALGEIVGDVMKVVDHILNANCKVCICGYTPLFLNTMYYGRKEMDFVYFNSVVLRAFDQKMREKAAEKSSEVVKYVSNFCLPKSTADLANYFQKQNDMLFFLTKANLATDGFHLMYAGYHALALRCIEECYKSWLPAPDARR